MTPQRLSRVMTPIGVGTLDALMVPVPGKEATVLVRFDRKDFAPEIWTTISPANGPCVFKEVEESTITEIVGGRPTMTPLFPMREPGANSMPITVVQPVVKIKPEPTPSPVVDGQPAMPMVGQIWKSKRSVSRFTVIKVYEGVITISEIGVPYKRDVHWDGLKKNYIFESAS